MSVLDEAKQCPKCSQPGEVYNKSIGGNGLTTHWVRCNNSLCPWYEETYFFQTRPDGSIPEPRR